MTKNDAHEQKFFNALNDIFVGAKIEGESGYINLMAIKSRYYKNGVFPQLKKDIDTALADFPDFREELFDKLYSFFQRYFSESGSIYFRHTPLHQNIYEKVYSDDRDVVLFWKTHMLYYVKTDRLFKSMLVEVDEQKFWFDASQIELKQSNEKRSVVFTFREKRSDGTLVFDVSYSERGSKTKEEEILKSLNKEGTDISDETLNKAFRVFEKQSEVDFFINKDARSFLREQFDMWLYQYLFEGQNVWSAERLAQLQALKSIAYKVIDFISQFEDELVKIWNKPKFVRNSHYVITLDKLQAAPVLDKILAHPNFDEQVREWRDLGMIDDAFQAEMLIQQDMAGGLLYPQYQHIPFDTKYFPDLELEILALFDNLDASLDGRLIRSENYQAINTMRIKFGKRIKGIYIDPPYNSDSSEIIYANDYKDASWLSLVENRLQKTQALLQSGAMLCIAIDDFELPNLSKLVKNFYTELGTVAVRSNPAGRSTSKGFSLNHEYAVFCSNKESSTIGHVERNLSQTERYNEMDEIGPFEWVNFRKHGGFRNESPKMYYPIYLSQKGEYRIPRLTWNEFKKIWTTDDLVKDDEIAIYPIDSNGQERRWKWSLERLVTNPDDVKVNTDREGNLAVYIKSRMPEDGITPGTWWDKKEFSATDWGAKSLKDLFGQHGIFSYPKAPALVSRCLTIMDLDDSDIVLDYFAGSGTTAHAVMNLNREDGGSRKYILVEMGEHFNTVILPRIKKVAFNSKWKNGKPVFSKGESGLSHFVKYYELEQYEDVLQKAHYEDSTLSFSTTLIRIHTLPTSSCAI